MSKPMGSRRSDGRAQPSGAAVNESTEQKSSPHDPKEIYLQCAGEGEWNLALDRKLKKRWDQN